MGARDWSLRKNSRNYVVKDPGEQIHAHNAEERARVLAGSQSLVSVMLNHYKTRALARKCSLKEAAWHCGMRP